MNAFNPFANPAPTSPAVGTWAAVPSTQPQQVAPNPNTPVSVQPSPTLSIAQPVSFVSEDGLSKEERGKNAQGVTFKLADFVGRVLLANVRNEIEFLDKITGEKVQKLIINVIAIDSEHCDLYRSVLIGPLGIRNPLKTAVRASSSPFVLFKLEQKLNEKGFKPYSVSVEGLDAYREKAIQTVTYGIQENVFKTELPTFLD